MIDGMEKIVREQSFFAGLGQATTDALKGPDYPMLQGLFLLFSAAIIITRNEAKNIAACLQSVAFCDEQIVVDSGSTDAASSPAPSRPTPKRPYRTRSCAPGAFATRCPTTNAGTRVCIASS